MSGADALAGGVLPYPGRVPHLPLGDVAEYAGERVPAAGLTPETFVNVACLLPNRQGRNPSQYVPRGGMVGGYREGDILLGNIGLYLRKICLATNSGGRSGDVLAVRIRRKYRERLLPGFLYYVLSSEGFFFYAVGKERGGTIPRGIGRVC